MEWVIVSNKEKKLVSGIVKPAIWPAGIPNHHEDLFFAS